MAEGSAPKVAKTDKYPERPYDEAKAKDADIYAPREQVDQIEDYHKTHKTLDTSGKEHDPEVQQKLLSKVVTPEPQAQDGKK